MISNEVTIYYTFRKFKKLQKILTKRESILIRGITKRFNTKKNLINEQVLNLNEHKSKLQAQHKLLMEDVKGNGNGNRTKSHHEHNTNTNKKKNTKMNLNMIMNMDTI